MNTIRWGAAALTAWLGTVGSISYAKPTDVRAWGNLRAVVGQPTRGQTSRPTQAEQLTPACIDVWSQGVMPILVRELCQHLQLTPGALPVAVPVAQRETNDRGVVVTALQPEESPTAERARLLVELANLCVREGKLDEARAHLRAAHLANPTCRFGQLAIQRLQELEAQPRTLPVRQANPEEPQEGTDELSQAQRVFQRVRQGTKPLGLVPTLTY